MSAPTQFKGKLNELLSQVRLQSQTAALSGVISGGGIVMEKYPMDPFLLQDIKSVLRRQQEGIHALVAVIKEDLADLGSVEEALDNEGKKGGKQF